MNLSNVQSSVSRGKPRTREGALLALREYEERNVDLSPATRRLLGIAAIGRYFGRRCLETALDTPLPNAPFRDWSWRWWNILASAGLDDHWDQFKRIAQESGVRPACSWLRRSISPASYALVLKRAGTNPHNSHRTGNRKRSEVWTKGGTWPVSSPFTKILVLKQHLPTRPLVTKLHRKLGVDGARRLERELMASVNPEANFRGDCIQQALDYISWRFKQLKLYPGPRMLCWFFQTRIPFSRTMRPLALEFHPHWGYVEHGPREQKRILKSWEF